MPHAMPAFLALFLVMSSIFMFLFVVSHPIRDPGQDDKGDTPPPPAPPEPNDPLPDPSHGHAWTENEPALSSRSWLFS